MKKIIYFAFLVCGLFLQSNLFANTVIVKGTVKDSANHAVANKTVRIYSTDSTNHGCLISHTVVTNPNGYYIDTLKCEGDIRKLVISIENCNGTKITTEFSVTSPVVESNFIVCVSPTIAPLNCRAAFSYTSVATGVKFNGAGSEAAAGDSIISRTWSFGDSSDVLSGNRIDPIHAYTKPGSYNVCLVIKTKKGCESKYCSTVVFTPQSNECKIEIKVDIEKISLKKFRFISGLSTTLLGDSIVQRTWKFGDGSSLDGNQLSPAKEYKDTGVYNVCVQVRTVKGCEKLYCFSVIVRDSLPHPSSNCKAFFTFTTSQTAGIAPGVTFKSAEASAGEGDSIISRTWSFGDSTIPLTGNRVDPSHAYTKAGTYTVCLVIKTKKGCESKYCTTVTYKPFGECFVQVHATVEPVSKKKFRFTSNTVSVAQGDSIIQRIWKFGDNTYLEGNEVYPVKEYKDTGMYTVCVIVKTARGCENKHCFTVIVRDSTASPKPCKAYFTYSIKDSIIRFSSAGSSAGEGDSIISRTWYYIDSTNNANQLTLTGNVIDTFFKYSTPGQYPVYLVIKTKKGCESKYTATVIIRPVIYTCELEVRGSAEKISGRKFRFSSSQSTVKAGDTIIHRNWKFGDGTMLEGNEINPLKEYRDTGSYTVCVKIKTMRGCEKEYCFKLAVRDSILHTPPTNCKALFSSSVQVAGVKFNSASSTAASADDSIISRTWIFGDTSAQLKGNIIDPVHAYSKPGAYYVYLYIKTKRGCESKYAATVVITPVNCSAEAVFSVERVGLKKVQFNSSHSKAQEGDSIIQRRWKFGDGTGLEGNVMNPLKEFPLQGVYNACLQVKTAKGCETQFCRQVNVQDSLGFPQTNIDLLKIISINPNPVTTRLVATIWSRNNNVEVEISIYDIYGTAKSTVKKVLTQGNNAIEIPTAFLQHGPYFLKVSTASSRNGRDTKAFYKL